VIEAELSTHMVHQAPLEPEVSLAYLEGKGDKAQLVVIGRSIDIHSHANQLKEAIGWDNVRYKEAYSGGQFGIKGTITSEGIAAAAALHFKRPVRYIPSLTESMLISSKRHPFAMKVKMGADANGKLTAYTHEAVVNKGAYALLGPIVPRHAVNMLNGSYNIPNINALVRMAYTNDASGGAARGAGPPQVAFALECAIDILAEKMGIDPLEFRRKNALQPGQTLCTGAVAEQWPFAELCDAIKPYYERAKKEAAAFKDGPVKRGVGIGCFSYGISEAGDTSHLAEELLRRGFEVRCLVRRPRGLGWIESLDVRMVRGDCRDKAALGAAVEGVDYVFHLAGVINAIAHKNRPD
jgi:aldehyde oxidoreductase